jgi:hypothetical protein
MRITGHKEDKMIQKLRSLLLIGIFCCAIQSCSYQSWYEGLHEQQRQDCCKIENPAERQECLDKVNAMTYDQYKKTREDSSLKNK